MGKGLSAGAEGREYKGRTRGRSEQNGGGDGLKEIEVLALLRGGG